MKKSKSEKSASEEKYVLVLRTCAANLSSSHGFVWPQSGFVEAPDWKPTKDCGNGLHGFLWGEGDGTLADWSKDAKWLVVRVPEKDIIDLVGKVKFRRGEVVFCGDRNGATKYLLAAPEGRGRAIIGASVDSSYSGKSTSGYSGTSTSGDYGTSTSGNFGKSTSGNFGTSTSGNFGTSTSGNSGKSMSGKHGLSLTGCLGWAKADENGILVITWRDEKNNRNRVTVAYVGEDGIEPNAFYKCDENGKIQRVS